MSLVSKWKYRERSYWVDDIVGEKPDVIIVGAGIVGVSTAIEIKTAKPDWTILILEKGSGTDGASVRNAGFACFGSISEILDDINRFGEVVAMNIVSERVKGLSMLKNRVSVDEMNYHFCGGYEVFEKNCDFEKYSEELTYINSFVSSIVEDEECFSIMHHPIFGKVIWNKFEGALQPAKMMTTLISKALQLGVHIHYNLEVKSIKRKEKSLQTTTGDLSFEHVIFCTNAWTKRVGVDIDVAPARNQVIITKPIDGLKLSGTFHMDKGYVYFRNVGNRILIGGRRNLDEEGEMTIKTVPANEIILDSLNDLLKSKILVGVNFEIDRTWTGHLGVGKDKRPIVENLDNGLWIAARMGGMGVAIGSFIGHKVALMVLRDEATSRSLNRY